MAVFRNVLFLAVAAGIISGVVMTALQAVFTVPLILQAETYEGAAPAHNHYAAVTDESSAAQAAHEHDEDAWAPADGTERALFNVLANLVTGIWFGNDDGKPMKHVTGGTLPARTWAQFMGAAHKGVPVAALPGNYLPETAALPVPRPVNEVSSRNAQGGQFLEPMDAAGNARGRPAERLTGGIRPAQDVGGAPRRRSLFDMLFGDRQG